MGYIFIIRSRIWAGSIINLVYRPQNLHSDATAKGSIRCRERGL